MRVLPLLTLLFAMVLASCAEMDQAMKSLGPMPTEGLTDDKIAAGLKEALRVGTANAVNATGRMDGYLGNQAIKILMPDKLQPFEKALRTIGFGPQVDDFVVSMNRAAERAAPQAKDIFWTAATEMTISDAKGILSGGPTAATEYFKGKTWTKLSTAFRPEVDKAMKEVGVTRQYKDLVDRFQAIPFAKSEIPNIDEYVVGKSLDGLFHVLGEEERKIRTNPAARVTDLLKVVFSQQGTAR